jgi:hypothetical protein
MPRTNYPMAQSATTRVTRFVPQASLAMGGVGAIVGGTAAAAKNIRRLRDAEINREEAVKDTFKEAAGAGLATATATAVVGAVGATGLLSLVGLLAVATGTKYLWDAATTPKKAVAAAPKNSKPKKETKSKS